MTIEELLRQIWRVVNGIESFSGGYKRRKIKTNPALYEQLKAECNNLVIPRPVRYTTIFGVEYEVDENVETFELVDQ